ncbi:hypothetical protein N7507_007953 [Penicillium longicatenatum]|nr:hypothetical protein N7507_007953 [Penicillium longicatenatum]
MKRTIGPLDQRRRITRCQPCATRRIKCEGGPPCEYCIRTGKICQAQRVKHTEIGFIFSAESTKSSPMILVPQQVHSPTHAVYLDHFADFLHQSHFTREFASVHGDLVPLVSRSPPLWHIAVAIGSLRASRRCSVRSLSRHESTHYVALKSYGASIQALQLQISKGLSACEEDTLWCTFLLGLFELMTKTSADEWAKHMVFGTSQILQSMKNTKRFPSWQKLFKAFQILEINRTILYGESTMLSQDGWPLSGDSMGSQKNDGWDSVGTILKLMMKTSSFSHSLFSQTESLTGCLVDVDLTLDALAAQGIEIQKEIMQWESKNEPLTDITEAPCGLAMANFHGLLLFHCKNFTYHSFWRESLIPSLQEYEIEKHVDAILERSDRLLRSSGIPGVLLLFPLRMAGANVSEDSKKRKILKLLDRIYRMGFVVADIIRIDLEDIWRYQALQGC